MKVQLSLLGVAGLFFLGILSGFVWRDPILLACCLAAMLSVGLLLFLSIRRLIVPLGDVAQDLLLAAEGGVPDVAVQGAPEVLRLRQSLGALLAAVRERTGIADSILENIITPMAMVRADGSIKWLNPSIIRLTEQEGEPADYLGRPIGEFIYGNGQPSVTDKALREKKKQFAKSQFESRKGNTKYVSIASAPVMGPDGELLGAFTSIMDFTNIKLKEDRITAQNESIARGVVETTEVSEHVSSAAQRLYERLTEASRGAEEQRTRTAEVATAVEQMNATILEVARNAADASGIAGSAQETARNGAAQVREVITVMDEVNDKAGALQTEMDKLGVQAEGIGRIMAVINDIADQTNLLALNAAIEAARAGDAGRGFAVVADEVRKLAEKTMQATNEVRSFIKAIQDSAQNNMKATGETAAVIGKATTMTHATGEALSQILHFVESTDDQVRSIATAAEEQSAASEEINHATGAISRITDETAQVVAGASEAITDLSRLAAELRQSMAKMQAGAA